MTEYSEEKFKHYEQVINIQKDIIKFLINKLVKLKLEEVHIVGSASSNGTFVKVDF